MSVDPIAERYADALFESAKAEAQVESVQRALATLGRLLNEQPMLGELLSNPGIAPHQKLDVLSHAFVEGEPGLVRAFVHMVIARDRVDWLPGMIQAFADAMDEDHGRIRVVVRSTHPLPQQSLQRLRKGLEQRERKHVELASEVEPALLGGLQVQLGHRVIDASVRRHLEELRRQLKSVRVH